MATYLSPGVYVEEKPSEIKPIAGVGTSTAGFIGFFPDKLDIPLPNPDYDPTKSPSPQPGGARPRGGGATAGGAAAGSAASPGGGGATGASSSSEANSPYIMTQFPADPEAEVKRARERAKKAKQDEDKAEKETRAAVKESNDAVAESGEVKLVTNFTEFQKYFGGFSTKEEHRNLAHAVYGFFQNGGTRCWIGRGKAAAEIDAILKKFEGIDEIAIVAAPGWTKDGVREAIVAHCEKMGDRFAILDTPEKVGDDEDTPSLELLTSGNREYVPDVSDNAALYFPWIQVLDPATKIMNPTDMKVKGRQYVPPSGHIAGIYARVDQERGVHKAPANATVRGALDLKYFIGKADQDGLNPNGINCIRDLNGAIRVWGARTLGGDRNDEWKYVNIRRTFLYLKESIDEGTQWVVFEPNDRMLWGKIVRNVSAFLFNVWRDGALFGSTAQEAFYVKCDDETNPPSIREQGQVVTEIGVALTRPAEFVIFRVSQWAGPQKQ